MCKKILSYVLMLAIMVSTVCFAGIGASAEEAAAGWQFGDRPFAVEGGRQNPAVINAADGEFYDDFIIPASLVFENFTSASGTATGSGFQLNNSNKTVITNNSGVEYAWLSLSEADENGENPNAYGGVGDAVKVTTGVTNGVTRPTSSTEKAYYNSVRMNGAINCADYPTLEDIAIAFWVKTTGPVQFSMAFWDTSTGSTAQKIYADPVNIAEAGEYIIAFPIQNFYVANTAYSKATGISTFKIQCPEILFKAAGVAAGEYIDIYFDNIGVYPVMPNFGKATHSRGAVIKDDMNDYVNSETAKQVNVSNEETAGFWKTTNNAASSFSAVERDGGKAICYDATNYVYTAIDGEIPASSVNFMEAPTSPKYTVELTDADGNNLGSNATLAFWVKASRASRILIKTNNNSGSAWLTSEEIRIPAGESIVRIPASQFIEQDSKFKKFQKLNIYFCCYSPRGTKLGGTFMIDDIAIEPTKVDGDVNIDKVCDLLDIVRLKKLMAGAVSGVDISGADLYVDSQLNSRDAVVLRKFLLGVSDTPIVKAALIAQESFVEIVPNSTKWTNKSADAIATLESSPYHYSGSEDTKALRVDYSSITNQAAESKGFYYNAGLANPYGSDGVFSFWVRADQSLTLRWNYLDDADYIKVVDGVETEQNGLCSVGWYTVTIPAGESIVEIPMQEIQNNNTVTAWEYKRVYQLQIGVMSNSASTKTEGTIYLDSFGFYDKDTTNDIPAVAE